MDPSDMVNEYDDSPPRTLDLLQKFQSNFLPTPREARWRICKRLWSECVFFELVGPAESLRAAPDRHGPPLFSHQSSGGDLQEAC